ncbi:AAA family ATPase [Kutzneria buriramensis]|uniref:helix-turn-helix transcriptional regulator n=1 Tax=Kutzneria buriramensis TaxID=1045776 RepID=UPI001477018E|nr:AAA family ATPase [Kutzneria buriramensis]
MGGTEIGHTNDAADVRSDEFDRLRAGLDRLAPGSGHTIQVTGEPGIGKSMLLTELAAEARRRGLAVCHGRSSEFERKDMFRSLANALGENVIAKACAELPASQADVITKHLLRAPRDRAGDGPDADVLPTLRALLTHLARDGMVLLLDDCHWADRRSTEFISFLARYPVPAPLLLVVAYRPRQACARLAGALAHGMAAGTVERIELGALSVDQSASLLAVDGRKVDENRLRDLHEVSKGNPLYLLALSEQDQPTELRLPRQREPESAGLAAALLASELATLSPDEMLVAEAAAVLGVDCDINALITVSELDRNRVCAATAGLEYRDVLRSAADVGVLTFRHPLLRQLVYAGTDLCWRNAAHRRALGLLTQHGASAEDRAWHVSGSIALFEPDDLTVLARAAADVLPDRPEEAIRLLRLALRLTAVDTERTELRLVLASALVAAGELSDARELLQVLIRHCPAVSAGQRVRAVAECALVECLLGNYTEASTVLAVELAGLREQPQAHLGALVRLLRRQAVTGLFGSELPDEELLASVFELARRQGDRVDTASLLALRGLLASYRGDVQLATGMAVDCAAIVDTLTDAELADHPDCLTLLGWVERILTRFADAERHLSRQVSLTRQQGRHGERVIALLGLSQNYQAVARLAEARRAAAEAAEVAGRIGARHVRDLAIMFESAYLAWIDRSDGSRIAVAHAEQAVAMRLPRGWWFGVQAILLLARVLEIEGDDRRCTSLVLHAGGGTDLPGIPPLIRPRCYEMLANAAANSGDSRTADWVRRCDEAAAAVGQPNHFASAMVARGHLVRAGQDYAAATALYQQAADLYGSLGMAGAQIRSLTFAAHSAELDNRIAEADAHLLLAKDLALQCGAVVLYEDAETLRRRIVPKDGTASVDGDETTVPDVDLSVLTKREREIARIAGTGIRTKKIAEQLSLSPRTVDVHLSHVYRKLNVGSRAALANLMAKVD